MTLARLFQSTYPHGVRLKRCQCHNGDTVFQSTYPHGVRRALMCLRLRALLFQSTYPHGVRPPRQGTLATTPEFQSTYPHGVRQSGVDLTNAHFVFQSTYPHGVRLVFYVKIHALVDFNPRTRTGYDGQHGHCGHSQKISIHVPARGTTSLNCTIVPPLIFQSTYPHGVRLRNPNSR